MHRRLVQLLKEIVPNVCCAQSLVAREIVERGEEVIMPSLRGHLGRQIGDYIVEKMILDGADKSCFRMDYDVEKDGMLCQARVHVLTPLELETMIKKAFEAGQTTYPSIPSFSFPYDSDFFHARDRKSKS